jgi:carbon storage regulator
MLVLSRRADQKIIISKDGVEIASVLILDIKHGTVRVGIEAPNDVSIHREEIWREIQSGAKELKASERRALSDNAATGTTG